MSRSVLQPSQQKLAEKLTILNDRGVGMLTRLYNIKKVRTGRRGRAGVRRRGQGRGAGGELGLLARGLREAPRPRVSRGAGRAGAISRAGSRAGDGNRPGHAWPPPAPGSAGRASARPSWAAAHGPGFLAVGVGECGARPSLRSPLGSLIFRSLDKAPPPPDSMLTFRRISFWRWTGGGSEGGTGFRLK